MIILAAIVDKDYKGRVETEGFSITQESGDGVLDQVVAMEVLRSSWILDILIL